jgi:hypothetical protein
MRAIRDQEFQQARTSIFDSEVQARPALVLLHVEVSALFDKESRGIETSGPLYSHHEWVAVTPIAAISISPRLEKRIADGSVPGVSRSVKV